MFNFRLKDIKDILPLGNDDDGYRLHWFALTDSHYWLTVGEQELFRYSRHCSRFSELTSPYVDYHLVRLLEDLAEILPFVLTPIPDDVYKYISSINEVKTLHAIMEKRFDLVSETEDEEEFEQIVEPLQDMLYFRRLSTGYLRNGPGIWLFRHHNEVTIQWNCMVRCEDPGISWSATTGGHTVNVIQFKTDLINFAESFLICMDEQVSQALNYTFTDNIELNTSQLIREHAERKAWLLDLIRQINQDSLVSTGDWDRIRRALVFLHRGI